MKSIRDIASESGIGDNYLIPYGNYKAKIMPELLDDRKDAPKGKLILVTAITPTPAGEGKTTTTVGLADGMRRIGKRAVVALREPSLGPVFGVKGGAAGGGWAQVVPMEDINLHFTGDLHAITSANNLLAALIDNHIFHGNPLGIDPRRVTWRRCMDMNDRQLRSIVCGIGGRTGGMPREEGFDITAASEVMACLCMADSITDLEQRLARIVVGYSFGGELITAGRLGASGAMAALLKEAICPNLVQTLEHTPALIHGGPFANIAHGCNSLIATRMAMSLGDYAITEAGFGADLGAEKFFDIKCRIGNLKPDAVVVVATVRALKMHGGVPKAELSKPDPDAVKRGMPNLCRHVSNIRSVFGLPAVVALNVFATDTDREIAMLDEMCEDPAISGVKVVLSDVWGRGGEGGIALAEEVVRLCETENRFSYAYGDSLTLFQKIEMIVKKVYRGAGVKLAPGVKKQLSLLTEQGFGELPVCIAKTQYSFSDNQSLTGAPEGFEVTVREVRVSAGAGFVVALTGDIMTMPGLPKVPSAETISIDSQRVIDGLF